MKLLNLLVFFITTTLILSSCSKSSNGDNTEKDADSQALNRSDTDAQDIQNTETESEKNEIHDEDSRDSGFTRVPAAAKIIAIGDIHGDITALRKALYSAGVIDEKNSWTGGETVAIQTGDILDRGDSEIEVIELLEKLKKEAAEAGGALYTLVGNHEIMNVQLDLRYVTDKGMSSFIDEKNMTREEAFKPGGPYAVLLAEFPVSLVIGENVFVHGGLKPEHVKFGLDKITKSSREWMLGNSPEVTQYLTIEEGIVWMRDYSDEPDETSCKMLEETLSLLDAKRMIVGHTVQDSINSSCGGKIWKIDTGMAPYYGGKVEVLEIEGDTITTLP